MDNKKKLKRRIKDLRTYLIILFFVKFFRLLPRRTGIATARALAALFYKLNKRHRGNTIRQLTMAFGNEKTDQEIRDIARRVFIHFATAVVDTIRIPFFLKQGIDRYITAGDIQPIRKAIADGKGFIILTGHFGNWELMGAWTAQHGFPLRVVGRSISDPRLDRLIVDIRNKAGYFNISRGKQTREILTALKNGYAIGMLIDQDTRVKGVFVDFFNKKAHTPIGPVVLARKFNIPIIPMFMYLKEDLTYRVECFPPVEQVDTGNREADIITNTQRCTDVYERIIRQHPEQWAWMHRRWKKQPEPLQQIESPARNTGIPNQNELLSKT